MRKLRALAVLAVASGAVALAAAPASARCADPYDIECNLQCWAPEYDPEHGLRWHHYYC